MPSAVLDASALLALLLGEPGAALVRAALAGAAMSTVNLAEVVGAERGCRLAILGVRLGSATPCRPGREDLLQQRCPFPRESEMRS